MNTVVPKSATEVHEKQLTYAFNYGKIDYIKTIGILAQHELSQLNRFFKFYLSHANINNRIGYEDDLTKDEENFFKLYNQKLKTYQKIDRIHSLCQYYLKQL